ncbi:MAG TPA: UDP-N-acetylmuramate dehydrogenase [Planctomycetes bacterium]|nr:UDP-N-acetylmuramate dehydrogenase [Fuerstiella sp.]HIK94693.1 UDP-N-acetylmuramate dehydrogenase [Planctomycetota bacterium]
MTNSLDEFNDILSPDESLAQHTWLKLGGNAERFYTPTSRDQLLALIRACVAAAVPVRVFGSGSNLLVHDGVVSGAVIRIVEPLLGEVKVSGDTVTAGGGALLSHVVSESVRAGLAGLENLVGIPGTVGGAVVGNAGGRHADIGEFVRKIEVVTHEGEIAERSGDELTFAYRSSNVTDLAVLSVTLQLRPDDSDDLTVRMKKIWIIKRSTQPLADQSAGCIFRNPRGLSAGALIEQCGLKDLAVGGARISDRHANFVVTGPGATSADVESLIGKVKVAVAEKFGVELELEIRKW